MKTKAVVLFVLVAMFALTSCSGGLSINQVINALVTGSQWLENASGDMYFGFYKVFVDGSGYWYRWILVDNFGVIRQFSENPMDAKAMMGLLAIYANLGYQFIDVTLIAPEVILAVAQFVMMNLPTLPFIIYVPSMFSRPTPTGVPALQGYP